MLRESDNSMMAITSAESFPIEPAGRKVSLMPAFGAPLVQETGMNAAVAPDVIRQAFRFGSKEHPQLWQQAEATNELACFLRRQLWKLLERGLEQRFRAVNACLSDIVRFRRVPEFLQTCGFLKKQISDMLNPLTGTQRTDGLWAWFGTTDIHLSPAGHPTVLDHNFSLPTGLELFDEQQTAGSNSTHLKIPDGYDRAGVTVVLVPGRFSAAERGNDCLARLLQAQVVRSSDLSVGPNGVFLHSAGKPVRVSTIVRRIDDDLLDPNCYRPDSLVGVPGLVRAWKNGQVDVLNAPGTGLANSRTFGKNIPRLIRHYLGEEPLLDSARVLECEDGDVLRHVLSNLKNYAIRTNDPLHPSRPFFGRRGMAVEFADLLSRLRKNPEAFVARPLLEDSHDIGVNLRFYATAGEKFRLLPGVIGRTCHPDGGASLIIRSQEEVMTLDCSS